MLGKSRQAQFAQGGQARPRMQVERGRSARRPGRGETSFLRPAVKGMEWKRTEKAPSCVGQTSKWTGGENTPIFSQDTPCFHCRALIALCDGTFNWENWSQVV